MALSLRALPSLPQAGNPSLPPPEGPVRHSVRALQPRLALKAERHNAEPEPSCQRKNRA